MLYLKFILSINVAFKMRSVVFHLSYSVTPSNSGVCAGFQQPLKSFFLKLSTIKLLKLVSLIREVFIQ